MNTHDILAELVAKAACKPGWSFAMRTGEGEPRLVITVDGVDSYDPTRPMPISHWFPVPSATFNEKTWRRWIFECCRGVENHELGEWFRIGDDRPFVPMHGPGENPYLVVEYRDEVDSRTTQDGTVRP